MKIVIIISTFDYAGLNIKDKLLSLMEFKDSDLTYEDNPILECSNHLNTIRIYTSPTRCVNDEGIDEKIGWDDCDLIIYPITHRSESGKPSLTVHAPGNWSKAELGGKDKKLCYTNADMIKVMIKKLVEYGEHTGHDITMECTHHGPFVRKPIIFIEIGSSENEWKNPELGRIIAKTLNFVLNNKIPENIIAFGVGGTHYCTNFKRIVLEKDIAIGHVCPKYALQFLDKEMINQAMKKSNAKFVIVDWKGMGDQRERIIQLLEEMSIKYEKAEKIKKQ